MILPRHFLTQRYTIRPRYVVGTLVLWVLSTLATYSLFQLVREAFRYYTGQLGGQELLVLTPVEHYWHNVFAAAMSAALGYGVALRFLLRASFRYQVRPTQRLMRRAIHNAGFTTWNTWMWFGHLSFLLGLLYSVLTLHHHLDWLRDLRIFLILLPLTVFLGSWPQVSRLVRRTKLRWMLSTLAIFLVLSFGLGALRFTHFGAWDAYFFENAPTEVYDYRPASSHTRIEDRGLRDENVLYMLRDTLPPHRPVFFVFEEAIGTTLSNVTGRLLHMPSAPKRIQDDVELRIDARLSMGEVLSALNSLNEEHPFRNWFLNTVPVDAPLSPRNAFYKNRGLPLYRVLPEFGLPLDMTTREVRVTAQGIFYEGKMISPSELDEKLTPFIRGHAPCYGVVFTADPEVSYQAFVTVYDQVWRLVDQLRDRYAQKLFGRPFLELEGCDEHLVLSKYPRYLLVDFRGGK